VIWPFRGVVAVRLQYIVKKINDSIFAVYWQSPLETFGSDWIILIACVASFLAILAYFMRKDVEIKKQRLRELQRLNDVLERLEKMLKG